MACSSSRSKDSSVVTIRIRRVALARVMFRSSCKASSSDSREGSLWETGCKVSSPILVGTPLDRR